MSDDTLQPGQARASGAPELSDSDGIAALIAMQSIRIVTACGGAIVKGFTSASLGSPYVYGASLTDQANLTAVALEGLVANSAAWTTSFKCADPASDLAKNGSWVLRPHTLAQLAGVGADFAKWKNACIAQKDAILASIAAATDANVILGTSWTDPVLQAS